MNNKKMKPLKKEDIINLLYQIDSILNASTKISLYGGSALVLMNLRDKTKDIDYVCSTPKQKQNLNKAIEETSKKNSLDSHFMNDDIEMFSSLYPEYINYNEYDFKKIILQASSPRYLLISKLIGRLKPITISSDVKDVWNLINILNIKNIEQIKNICNIFYPDETIQKLELAILEEIIDRKSKNLPFIDEIGWFNC